MIKNDYIDPAQAAEDISTSYESLSDDFERHAALTLHYGIAVAESTAKVSRLKIQFDALSAQTAVRIRAEHEKENKKMTENLLKELVSIDPKLVKMKINMIDVTSANEACKATFEAFKHRRDMLVQMSKTVLEEHRGQMRAGVNPEDADQRDRVAGIMQKPAA